MGRRLNTGVVFMVWAVLPIVTLIWIVMSDAVGQEVGREPSWRLPWLPVLLSVAWGAFATAVGVAIVGFLRRRGRGHNNDRSPV